MLSVVSTEEKVNNGAEDMQQYLQEVRQYPLLTPEQERQLAISCAQGDEEAIRKMVSANLRLVVSVARDYAGRGVPLLDLIQEGSIGLLVAARKFDYTMENRFSTYATKWIRQCIIRYIRMQGSLIRVPDHTYQKIRQVLAAKDSFTRANGEEPTLAEIARMTQLEESKVDKLLQLWPEVFSLDATLQDEETTYQTFLEDTQALQPQQLLVRAELHRTMDALLCQLNSRQQQVLRLHFGMEDGICHSLEEIGGILGVSKERARQIEQQAMDKLRTMGADMGLEDFLN